MNKDHSLSAKGWPGKPTGSSLQLNISVCIYGSGSRNGNQSGADTGFRKWGRPANWYVLKRAAFVCMRGRFPLFLKF